MPESDRKKAYAEELVEEVIQSPAAAKAIVQASATTPIFPDVLLQESQHHQLTEDDLVQYINLRNGVDYPKESILALKELFVKQFEEDHRVEVTSQCSGPKINELTRAIASQAFASIRTSEGRALKQSEVIPGGGNDKWSAMPAWQFANVQAVSKVKRMLSCEETLSNDGRYDIPQCHHLIYSHWVELVASVRAQLIKRVPSLKAMSQLVWSDEQEAETEVL